jgi:hypothetical protein
MNPPDPDQSPIFVIGTGRSGTTLLRQMLNAHPRIYLTQEASFYIGSNKVPKRFNGSDWLDLYFRSFSFAWLRVDPNDVLANLPRPLPREQLPDAYRAIMRCKAREFDKPRYGDKTPFHSSYLKQMYEDFPDARIVHIVRDPRPTVASLQRMPWAASSHILNNAYCFKQMREVAPFRERMHELRLEDLLADPRGVMAGVLEFVGEEWSDDVLDHSEKAPSVDMPPFPWLLTATKKRGTSRTSWRDQLSPQWIRQIEWRNRETMELFGYERAELEVEPSRWSRLGAVLAEIPESLRFMGRFLPLARALMSRNPPDAAHAQAKLLGLNPDAWQHYPGFVIPDRPAVPDWTGADGKTTVSVRS